jgi:TRAP-type C4-dicarboxylate transport system permease small subunit
MEVIARLTSGASRALAVFAGLGALFTMALICVDVTLRFFDSSLPGTTPFVANYLMIMVAFLPLARVERDDMMITVDVVSTMLSPFGSRMMIIAAGVISIAIYLALTNATWQEAMNRYDAGAYEVASNITITIWPAYFIIPVSFTLAAIVVMLRTVQAAMDRLPDQALARRLAEAAFLGADDAAPDGGKGSAR